MNQRNDLDDILPSLASRGPIVVRDRTPSPNDLVSTRISGRYLDPVTSSLGVISDVYYNHPVETYLKGRSDFIYDGQKPGNFLVKVVDIMKDFIMPAARAPPEPEGKWRELKITSAISRSRNSCYTNMPAQY